MKQSQFIGTWKLVYFKNTDEKGIESFPLGENASGYISYHTDGYMFVVLTKEHREPFVSNDLFGGTETEKAIAYDSFFSYTGKYEIKDQTVIHHIRSCTFPNWSGTDQIRNFTFAKNSLILSTPPYPVDGSVQVSELRWERVY